MAVKKDRRQSITDPAVDAHFADLGGAVSTSTRKRIRQQKIDHERKEKRTSWDIDPEIKIEVDKIAAAIGTSQSQVAAYLIVAGLTAVERGVIPPPDAATEKSNSMRFAYVLKIPSIPKKTRRNDAAQ